jgi:hypothetical protein
MNGNLALLGDEIPPPVTTASGGLQAVTGVAASNNVAVIG